MILSVIFAVFLLPNASMEDGILSSIGTPCVNGKRPNGDGVIYKTVRYGHYIELDCCCCEGNVIGWVKWSNETKQWQQFVPDRNEVKFMNNRHILSVQSSTFEDSGLYRCNARNGSAVTVAHSTTFLLDVVACDKLARGPYAIVPTPCDETITHEKEVLTLPCTGYFGCEEEGDITIATWFVSLDKNKADHWLKAVSTDKRYRQIDFQRDGNSVKGSNLTIHGVSALDFNRKFMCLLASPQMVQGQTKLIVTLKKSDKLALAESAFSSLVIMICLSAIVCVSVIVNVGLLVLTRYRGRWENQRRMNKDASCSHTCEKWTAVNLKDTDYT